MYKQSKVRWSFAEHRKQTTVYVGNPDVVVNRLDTGVITGLNWRDSSNTYPDWRSRLKHGLQCTNPLSGVKCELVASGSGSGVLKYNRWPGSGYELFEFSGTPTAYFSSAESESSDFSSPGIDAVVASNHASRVFLKKLLQEKTAFQGGIFVGELRESLKMILRPASGLRDGIAKFLSTASKRSKGLTKPTKRQLLDARNLPPQFRHDARGRVVMDVNAQKMRKDASYKSLMAKMIADTWLEVAFGWGPLVNDLQEAVIAYGKLINEIHQKRISAYGHDETSSRIFDTATFGAAFPMLIEKRIVEKCSVRYLAGLRSETSAVSPTGFLSRWFGFTIDQFIPTLWELTPWSFLADYVTNIGDILDGHATSQENVNWVNVTVRKTRDEVVTARFDSPRAATWYGNDVACQVNVSPMHKRTTSVVRNAAATVPLQTFMFEVPTSPKKWANMAALLAGGRNLRNSFL